MADVEVVMAVGYGEPCPKPESRRRVKARRKRARAATVKAIRLAVFDREQGICRCCRKRLAESMHEIRPRSLGGRVSLENSIAVCGSGTTGCHGFIQSHRILVSQDDFGFPDANSFLVFTPLVAAAREWMETR